MLPDRNELKGMVANLGDKRALLMRNHGLITVGRTVPEAFHLIYYLEQACQLQIDLLASGTDLAIPPMEIQNAARDYFVHNKHVPGEREWPALLRMLDRIDPTYRD